MAALKTRMIPISQDQEKIVNIFIHGYRVGRTETELRELQQQIAAAQPRGQSYLLAWEAGDWSPTFFNAAKAGLDVLISPENRIESLLKKGLGILEEERRIFDEYKRRSEELGARLPAILEKTAAAKKYPVNLFGHSLGARVIHSSLAKSDLADFRIQDCIMMAGCADETANDWQDCLDQIIGKLYNFYSPSDRVLLFAETLLGDEPKVGRSELHVPGVTRIKNFNFPSFRHTDYWPNLLSVLRKAWPAFRKR